MHMLVRFATLHEIIIVSVCSIMEQMAQSRDRTINTHAYILRQFVCFAPFFLQSLLRTDVKSKTSGFNMKITLVSSVMLLAVFLGECFNPFVRCHVCIKIKYIQ